MCVAVGVSCTLDRDTGSHRRKGRPDEVPTRSGIRSGARARSHRLFIGSRGHDHNDVNDVPDGDHRCDHDPSGRNDVLVHDDDTTTSPYGGATLLTSIIQQELRILGYFNGEPDGILGPVTEEALREFQTEAGITVDGDYGPETYVALADALEADTDFITAVQEDLMELKLYPGPADGDYGSGTVKGIESLQEQCGIEIDGRFTPQTHLCLEAEMGRL